MAAVVIASRNKHKVREIRQLLSCEAIKVLSLEDCPGAPDVVEDGVTFADNALKKARAIAEYTGLTALADDSGLEVDYLGGQPGVYSARFAGDLATDAENNAKLLKLMEGVPMEQRTARFRCSIALVSRFGPTKCIDGTCEGLLLFEQRGVGGFGYDPLFLVPDLELTFAELSDADKNRISHRGKALRATVPVMQKWLAAGQI